MSSELITLAVLAGGPALALLVGGALSLVHRPSSLVSSIAFGFGGGALIGTVTFEMLPRGVEIGGLPIAVGGFTAGFVAIYLVDLYIHRGTVAGERAEQRRRVEERWARKPPRGGPLAVMGGGASLEDLAEGLTIGASLAVAPQVALVVGLGIALDNLGEGMAIGELAREQHADDRAGARRATLLWTLAVAVSLFVSALVAWVALRGLSDEVHALLISAGGGAMLYLTLSDLLPEGQTRHYQQSSALAAGAAVALMLVLSRLAQPP